MLSGTCPTIIIQSEQAVIGFNIAEVDFISIGIAAYLSNAHCQAEKPVLPDNTLGVIILVGLFVDDHLRWCEITVDV